MPNRSAVPIKAARGSSECNPRARAAEIAEEKSNLKLKWGEFVSPLLSLMTILRAKEMKLARALAITSRFDSDSRRAAEYFCHCCLVLLSPLSFSLSIDF